MTVRDERAAALIRRHRDLSDDFTRALPGLLDDLEAIDQAHSYGSELAAARAEVARLRELLNEARIADPDEPLDVSQVDPAIGKTAAALAEAAGQTPKRAAPAKPATRRRPAR